MIEYSFLIRRTVRISDIFCFMLFDRIMFFWSFFALVIYGLLACAAWCRRRTASTYRRGAIGFVHPAAAAGGGGERVLWMAVEGVMKRDMQHKTDRVYVVYCNQMQDEDTEVLALVKSQFNIVLPRPVKFVFLRPEITKWLNGEMFPVATLLLQTLVGGLLLFYECAIANTMTPIAVETVGIPFLYPLLRVWSGSYVIAYIHYPVISSRMTDMVRSGVVTTTNRGRVVSFKPLRWMKLVYYLLFMQVYRLFGQFPHLVLTNSTWTNNHISSIFKPRQTFIVFPPCNVEKQNFRRKTSATSGDDVSASAQGNTNERSLPTSARSHRIVSVGQFRPEKNHALQIKSFHQAKSRLPSDTTLVLIGGARNDEDYQRVKNLKGLIDSLNLTSSVELRVNAPYQEVQHELNTSLIGLHTMRDEHFGIVIVEYMAAGCIVLAHRSGGVALDLVRTPQLGFLAETEAEYADAMCTVFHLHHDRPHELEQMRTAAMAHALSFDDELFQRHFTSRAYSLLDVEEEEEEEGGVEEEDRVNDGPLRGGGIISFEEYAAKRLSEKSK